MTTQAKTETVKWGAFVLTLATTLVYVGISTGDLKARVSEVERKAESISTIREDVAVIKAIVERQEQSGRKR